MDTSEQSDERLIPDGTSASCSHSGVELMHQQQGRAHDHGNRNHVYACSHASLLEDGNTAHCCRQATAALKQSSPNAATACSHSHHQHAASLACHENQQCDDAAPLIAHRHRSCSDAQDSTSAVVCSGSPTSLGSERSNDKLFEVVIDGAFTVTPMQLALQACTWCCGSTASVTLRIEMLFPTLLQMTQQQRTPSQSGRSCMWMGCAARRRRPSSTAS